MSNTTAQFHLEGVLYRSSLAPAVFVGVLSKAELSGNLVMFTTDLRVSSLKWSLLDEGGGVREGNRDTLVVFVATSLGIGKRPGGCVGRCVSWTVGV